MLRYTRTTKNRYRQNHSTLHSFNLIFFKLAENDFRGLHLHSLKSLRRYHRTLHSHKLTFTTLVKIWFQGSTPAQPEIFVDDIIVHYTRTSWLLLHSYNLISGFYACTTWNLYLYGKVTYFTLHSHTLIFITFKKTWFLWLFHSCCVCMHSYIYIFRTYINV